MNVSTVVVEEEPVPFALLQPQLFDIRKRLAVDRPMVEIFLIPRNLADQHFEAVIERFTELRQKNLSKKPATSELIDWIACLQQKNLLNSNMANWKYADDEYKKKLIETLGIITKSKADFETVSKAISG